MNFITSPRAFAVLLVVAVAIALASCGSSSSTVQPGGVDVNINNPGLNDNDVVLPGEHIGSSITVEQRFPSPYESQKSWGVHVSKFQIPVEDLEKYADRSASAVVNMDSEVMYPTLNATAVLLYNQQNSSKTFNGGLGSWTHSFVWDSTDTNANRNTQAVTWLGLVNADKLHDIYDGATQLDTSIAAAVAAVLDTTGDSDGPGGNADTANGFLGEMFNQNRFADDTNSATGTDRPYPYEVVLCSRVANYLNDPKYDVMAQTWFEGTTDELSGSQEVDRLLTNGRASLTLWDCESRIRAAAVTYNYAWAEALIAQLETRRADWDGQLLGGWDYTPLGWEAIAGALAELKFNEGADFSPLAQQYLTEALTKLKGNPNHHQVQGYYGFEQGGRTFDDTQQNAYALQSIAHADYFGLNGSDTTLLSRGNRALEYFKKNVLPYSSGINLDGASPANDAGAVLSGYRGPIVNGAVAYNLETTSEWLNGASELASVINRYPNTPLY